MRPALLVILLFFPASLAAGEAGGGVFLNEGAPGDLLAILRGQGIDTVRLRLWHTPADGHNGLDETLDLATRCGKDLVVVETACLWTLGWFDDTPNIVGLPEHLQPGYPAIPAGQQAFLAAVLEVVRTVPDDRGRGVFWWAPEWTASAGFGSAWENLTLFDETGEALPALGE